MNVSLSCVCPQGPLKQQCYKIYLLKCRSMQQLDVNVPKMQYLFVLVFTKFAYLGHFSLNFQFYLGRLFIKTIMSRCGVYISVEERSQV